MKVTPSIKPRCEFCQVIIRRKKGKVKNNSKPTRFVICKRDRRHNQRQG